LAREKEKATDVAGTFGRLLTYFKPYWALLLVAGVLLLLNTAMQILEPYLREIALDQFIIPAASGVAGPPRPAWLELVAPTGIASNQELALTGLTRVMFVLLSSFLLSWLATSGMFYLMTVAGQKVLLTMRTQILERIQSLSLKFFDEREAGDLMSRLVNDTQVVNEVFSGSIMRMLSMSLTLVGIAATMILRNWALALAGLAILPVMILATSAFAKRARVAFRKTRETIGNVSSELQENISGVREVQAFARERENVAEFRQINRQNRDANVQAQTLTSAFTPALDTMSTIALALVLGVGGYMVVGGWATVGIVAAYMTYVRRFYRPVQAISSMWAQFQSALAGAERIFELIDTEPDIVDAPDAIALPPAEGRIAFDGVHFCYKPDEPVLQDIHFAAEPGQTVALVGPTGAGKTSIVSLLMRFYDIQEGSITVDGHDIRQVTHDSLREQMSIVLQDTFLFSGSVIDNIRYGRLDATDEEVKAAARLANADDFIARLPDGYDTDIGERGHNLSQGQRQLLSISRAILADPRILILDEATSSVDTRTELLIQKALGELLHGRTSIVIAHRLSTIRNADQVLVLDHGEIVERGTHNSLMEKQGRYYELYMSQFRREGQGGPPRRRKRAPAGAALPSDFLEDRHSGAHRDDGRHQRRPRPVPAG
jgi:ABC-type multidrug transport system fused ATPase/permease subunit